MNKYVSFFLKTQLAVAAFVLTLLIIASPLALVSLTQSTWPMLLWIPMGGILITIANFMVDE